MLQAMSSVWCASKVANSTTCFDCIKFSVFDFVEEGGKLVNLHAAVLSEDYVVEEAERIVDAGLMLV